MATTKVEFTLKLLIDKKSNKVVFAEAGKDFVDFLFSILSFPIGTMIKLLSQDQILGCLGNLYRSVEDLDDRFIQPATSKDPFLKPKPQQVCTTQSNLFSIDGLSGPPTTNNFYRCSTSNCTRTCVTDIYGQTCPSPYCRNSMTSQVSFTGTDAIKNKNEGGLVKGVISYMVMDDLDVKPLSSISVATLLNKLNILQSGSLEEKVVEVGKDEGLKLLKASLQSKTVLTSVFLGS